jgi:hypothetical protein
VRLVVQIQAVADELIQIDLGRTLGAPTISAVAPAIIATAIVPRPAFTGRAPVAFARRPGFAALCFLLLSHDD